MSMSDSSFEYILQALHMQKQNLEQLQAENSDLRHQLADLRNGQGIFVEILGVRFALVGTQPSEMLEVLAHETAQEASTLELALAPTVDAPTTAMPFIPETPRPVKPMEEQQEQITEEIAPSFSSSLLEDEMYEDDFADSATNPTSPIAVWKGAEANRRAKGINEDEKAALRRELIGSFLLE